ncbi:hypothetical protein ACFOGI_11070 [Virgibacillus xinjiangensis]|uniref:Response regulatory domain-containing protein n=1 Tax=Virgibacillus xinjiangensis TaxID=393090 RepID=A0ABV7CWE8_9BACI
MQVIYLSKVPVLTNVMDRLEEQRDVGVLEALEYTVDALEQLLERKPDVVVWNTEETSPLEVQALITELKERKSGMAVILLTAPLGEDEFLDHLTIKANGLICRDEHVAEETVKAVQAVREGGFVMPKRNLDGFIQQLKELEETEIRGARVGEEQNG